MPYHQNAFDDTANYNVSDTDDIVELPNQLLDAWVIYLTIDPCNDETFVT